MIVWVLIVTMVGSNYAGAGVSMIVIDNIASAESCEQLAKVIRKSPQPAVGVLAATCAPVRKVK